MTTTPENSPLQVLQPVSDDQNLLTTKADAGGSCCGGACCSSN